MTASWSLKHRTLFVSLRDLLNHYVASLLNKHRTVSPQTVSKVLKRCIQCEILTETYFSRWWVGVNTNVRTIPASDITGGELLRKSERSTAKHRQQQRQQQRRSAGLLVDDCLVRQSVSSLSCWIRSDVIAGSDCSGCGGGGGGEAVCGLCNISVRCLSLRD